MWSTVRLNPAASRGDEDGGRVGRGWAGLCGRERWGSVYIDALIQRLFDLALVIVCERECVCKLSVGG